MVHVHPRWPVLTLEGVASIGAVEEEDTEAAVVVDPGLVEDTREVEVASGGQEAIVVAGEDTGVLIEAASGGLVGVDSEGLVDTEDLTGVEVEEEDMEGGDSEEAGGETGVVIKTEHLNKDIFWKV